MFSMNFSWFHYPGYKFNKLTWVGSSLVFSLLFSIECLFLFYLSMLGWLKIELHNFFRFASIRLSLSHDLSHRLTWVDYVHFFIPFLVGLRNFFYLFSMGLSWSHDSGREFGRLIRVDSIYFLRFFFNWIIFS